MRIEVSGTRLGYDTSGSGPPLVLLHAFPLNRAMWNPQVAALADRFTVVAPDFRGFGESEAPAGPLTMDDYARDVLAMLDQMGYERFALAGCSMGGYVAFRLLAAARDRITVLLLADTRAEPDSEEGRQRRLAAIRRIEHEGPSAWLEETIQNLLGPTTRAERPGVIAAVRQIVGTPSHAGLTAALHAMAGRPDSRPMLGNITCPTLVLVGEEDAVTPPAAAEAMAKAIPHAQLVQVPGAGHLANLEAPEAFNRAIREFLLVHAPG